MAAGPLLRNSYKLHPTQGPMPQPASSADINGYQNNAAAQQQHRGLGLQGSGAPSSVPLPGPSRQGSCTGAGVGQAAQLARHSHTGVPPPPVPPGYGASSSSSSSRPAPGSVRGKPSVRQSRSFRSSGGQGVGAGGDSRGVQDGGVTTSGSSAQPAAVQSTQLNGQDSRQHAFGQGQPHSSASRRHVQKDSGGVSASGGTQCSSGAQSSGAGMMTVGAQATAAKQEAQASSMI
jgi:hypothetical protein